MKTDEKNCCLKATQSSDEVICFDFDSSLMPSSSMERSPGSGRPP